MKNIMESKETLGIYLFMAIVEAIGLFLFICGMFHITITEIGRIASVGYMIGLGGVFFAISLFLHLNHKAK